jgi:hypothetical protein
MGYHDNDPAFDPFSLENLRLPVVIQVSSERRLPRHGPRDAFIKGPIPRSWMSAVCRLRGKGLHVAMSYRFHADRFRYPKGRHWSLKAIAAGLGISLDTARRALHAAELGRLVTVEREPGHKMRVSISEPTGEKERCPLYGPIPASWWFPACRLPGKALQVATVCWWLARRRRTEFGWLVGEWAEFGLSRFSASRGLRELERAGLVRVARSSGYSSTVTILDYPGNGQT